MNPDDYSPVDDYARAEFLTAIAERAAYEANRVYKAARRAYDHEHTTDARAVLALATHELKYHQRRLARQRNARDRAEEAARIYLQSQPRKRRIATRPAATLRRHAAAD